MLAVDLYDETLGLSEACVQDVLLPGLAWPREAAVPVILPVPQLTADRLELSIDLWCAEIL